VVKSKQWGSRLLQSAMIKPKQILDQFLVRSVLLLLLFFGFYYSWMMAPVNSALTKNTAYAAAWVSSHLGGGPVEVTEVNIGYKWRLQGAGKRGVSIAHPCNAFELYCLYVGFILAFANVALLRKLVFIASGLLSLYLFNLLRVVLLFYISGRWPDFFDFMHKYLFQAGAYVLMFGLWYGFLHKNANSSK